MSQISCRYFLNRSPFMQNFLSIIPFYFDNIYISAYTLFEKAISHLTKMQPTNPRPPIFAFISCNYKKNKYMGTSSQQPLMYIQRVSVLCIRTVTIWIHQTIVSSDSIFILTQLYLHTLFFQTKSVCSLKRNNMDMKRFFVLLPLSCLIHQFLNHYTNFFISCSL